MAYGTRTTISYLGVMAAGALNSGLGFAPGTKELAAQTKAVASGHIQKAANARQQPNVADTATIDALCNRDVSASGAFTGTVPAVYTSTLGVGFGMDRLAAHTTLMFGSSPTQMTQTFFSAEGLVSVSEQLAPTLSKLNDGVEFGKFPNLDSLVYPANGVFPNYLGSAYENLQSVVTNGISSLVITATKANFELLASDLENLGSAFDLSNIANFGNPGQIIETLNNANGLPATGLAQILAQVQLDPSSIYNLGSSNFNTMMQAILDGVNTPELIENAQTLLDSNVKNMESLGDYTNFDKIFVNSKDIISFTTMEEFQEKLQAIELGIIETVAQLASYVNKIEPVSLPTVHNTTIFTRSDYVDSLIAKFLGGTGTYGAITLSDMIGSLGGVKVSEFAAQYRTAMAALHSAGELTALATHLDQLNLGLKGDFTSGSDPNFTITDPDGPNVGPDANPYPDFQEQKIAQIEADCANLMARRNVNPDIQTAIDAWNNIFKQIFNEKDFQSRVDMGYDVRTDFSDNAYSFISGLRGTINEHDKLNIINGMINQAVLDGDVGGEYQKAYIKELENKLQADVFDIRWRGEFDD